MSEKLSGRIVFANQYLCNSEFIRLDIATEVSERFDCEFIRPRNFMTFSVIIICISDRINLESCIKINYRRFVVYVHPKSANSSQVFNETSAMITNVRGKSCRKSRKNHPLIF